MKNRIIALFLSFSLLPFLTMTASAEYPSEEDSLYGIEEDG